ncbi:hypothetical protein A1O1_06673 [Capronia coronata CBS 617.96]|uniref:AB hydrolase-1 domain-containing protein n=1 Tax=Capronia coronata CBS 617.96 TaxID=1182541 RepID=W9Y094_9EURO|nr:uncharacterized protein A1O1_06673 [Capronia coronata CBS 617.96]EXJ83055.1 hypothetical protein A1O1_06673 [Capronia coronata CBS 617.96]
MASKITSSGYIDSPSGRLFFEREGSPEGASILFIHGLGGTTNAYQMLVPELQDFDLVRFDWAGHGRSSVPSTPTSIESYVEDCEAVINSLKLTRVIAVGHSLGGLIALHLASKQPQLISSLVLFGPVRPPPPAGQTGLKARGSLVRKDGMVAVADTVVANAFAAESYVSRRAQVTLARELLTRQDPEGYALAVEALAASSLPAWEPLRGKRILILSGSEDKVSTVEAGQGSVKDIGSEAEQKVLQGVGHWHMLEDATASVQAIREIASLG